MLDMAILRLICASPRLLQNCPESVTLTIKMSDITNNHASRQPDEDEEILDGETCFETVN